MEHCRLFRKKPHLSFVFAFEISQEDGGHKSVSQMSFMISDTENTQNAVAA